MVPLNTFKRVCLVVAVSQAIVAPATQATNITVNNTNDTEQITVRVVIDTDGDGITDDADNCTLIANPNQRDSNGDGYGNICDPDLDNNCIVEACPQGFWEPGCVASATDMGLMNLVFLSMNSDADLNGDGIVNPLDFGVLRDRVGMPPGPSGLTNDCDATSDFYVIPLENGKGVIFDL